MHEKLGAFLAPLRDIDWSSWDAEPLGLLERPISFGTRYVSVPPEAVPLLGLGVDGCHYAAWVDDPGNVLDSPGVVLVSPMDAYPDAVRWVASSVRTFAALIRSDDPWLLRPDPEIAVARRAAEQERSAIVTAETADGMGLVEPRAPRGGQLQVSDDPLATQATIHRLVAQGALADALLLVRNVIAVGLQPAGFGATVASVYTALRRPELAEVALRSYERTAAQAEALAAFAAAIRGGGLPG